MSLLEPVHANPDQGPDTGPWLVFSCLLVTLLWWGFAFAPATSALPLLGAAQAYCFGTTENGLPAPWGWAVLVLAPLSLLSGILVAYGQESLHILGQSRRLKALTFLIVGLFLVESLWIARKVIRVRREESLFATNPMAGPLPKDYAQLELELPAFRLIDQRGEKVTPAALKGTPTILTFAYAHCLTVCPFLVSDTLKAVKAVPGTRAVFLTLDPWRDKPSALPSLARRFGMGAESRLLSGDPAQVQALLKGLEVPTQRDELTGVIDHPPLIYVLGVDGRIHYKFNRPPDHWLQEALRRLAKP